MFNKFAEIVASSLKKNQTKAKEQFLKSKEIVGVRHCSIDNLLPVELCEEIYGAFPDYHQMRHMKSLRENKYTSKEFDKYKPILKYITFAMQDPKVIKIVEEITGISEQQADPTLYAGGLSMMPREAFLCPHIDNSHDMSRKNYRTLNLLYYVTPDWAAENGGNLELWNNDVKNKVTIFSKFNRLVLMETNPWSWHSVSTVKVDKVRCCVSNYYFSPVSPTGKDYFNVTSFSAGPDERWRRYFLKADGIIRGLVRKIIPSGISRKDVYKVETLK